MNKTTENAKNKAAVLIIPIKLQRSKGRCNIMSKKTSKKIKRPIPEMLTPERYDLVGKMEAVSSTDQTGLITFAPVTEDQYSNYNEIMEFEELYGK